MESIKPFLTTGTVLVIDDTPNSIEWIPIANREAAEEFKNNFGVLPGKGAFYAGVLADFKYEVLYHDYNLVLKFK